MFKISKNRRTFEEVDGSPFFWLGDTAWELTHRLTRKEISFYLKRRQLQGFNIIQTVILAERNGLKEPNKEGYLPLRNLDPTQVVEEYFELIDFMLEEARKCNIIVALLPTWGDKFNIVSGDGPEIFTPENAEIYGKWLGNRYKEQPNLLWVLGGDRHLETEEHFAIVDAMAKGLRAGDEAKHYISFHPKGCTNVLQQLGNRDWLDISMIQSGHCRNSLDNFNMLKLDYAFKPTRPIMDGESCYEEMPRMDRFWGNSRGYYNAFEVRRAAYWNLLSGSAGYTYGAHPVWQMHIENGASVDMPRMSWRRALELPAAQQMKFVKKLFLDHQLHLMTPLYDFVEQRPELYDYVAVMANKDESKIVLYSPDKSNILVKKLKNSYNIIKYNTSTGDYMEYGSIEAGTLVELENCFGDDEVTILEIKK